MRICIMRNFKELIQSFVKSTPKRVVRNEMSYQQTSDFTIAELERLLTMYNSCIEEDQTARSIRDSMVYHIRHSNDYAIREKFGSHYRQDGVDEHNCTFEHIMPVNIVVSMLIEGRLTINQALNTPTCLISKDDDVILRERGLGSRTPDNWYFFRRYTVLNSSFKTYNGHVITNFNEYSLEDHFKLFGIV